MTRTPKISAMVIYTDQGPRSGEAIAELAAARSERCKITGEWRAGGTLWGNRLGGSALSKPTGLRFGWLGGGALSEPPGNKGGGLEAPTFGALGGIPQVQGCVGQGGYWETPRDSPGKGGIGPQLGPKPQI